MGVKLGISHQGKNFDRMFEIRVLMRILRPERNDVTGGWSKLDNEEFHNLYTSLNTVRIIKSG
jgi:hypothetical protein